jgi:SAM-dependent methyltransferase
MTTTGPDGGIIGFLRRQRHLTEDALTRRGLAHIGSLPRLRLHRELTRLIEGHARGAGLDAGSGRSPYRDLLLRHCNKVTSIDTEVRTGIIDRIADIQRMPEIPDGSFDTILCTQVLEHVPRPWDALGEMQRVLRAGGVAILSVPHLSIIHEAPHDYFRYTRYGMQELCGHSGLEVLEIAPTGGLPCFLGHGASSALMSTLGAVPGLRWPILLLNYLLLVLLLGLFDRLFGLAAIYPCDYVVLARKPGQAAR